MESPDPNIVYIFEPLEGYFAKPEDSCLGNFHIAPFYSSSGTLFPSVEHYYQAHKFGNFSQPGFKDIFEEIRTSQDGESCVKIARKYLNIIDPAIWGKDSWDKALKDFYMKRGLTYKFSQHNELLKKLLSTGDKILIEESKEEKYWGGFAEGSLNKFGLLAMELRGNFRSTGTVFLTGSNIEPIKVTVD